MSEPRDLPAFLRNPGSSFGFVTWLRKFLEDNPPQRLLKTTTTPPSTVLYDYTLPSAQVSIDTLNDGPGAGPLKQQFKVLEVWFYGRTDGAVTQSNANITFNNDSGANYDVIGAQANNATVVVVNQTANHNQQFPMPGNNAVAGRIGVIRFSIPGYTDNTFEARGEGCGGFESNADSLFRWCSFQWRPSSLAAVAQIKVIAANGNWIAGSRLLIVGR